MKKVLSIVIAVMMIVGLSSCISIGDLINDDTNGTQGPVNPGASDLKDGKWPASVYSKYGIDEISTKGKIVFTNFENDSSYQYEVYYNGVTREELVAWTNGLFENGLRAADRDKERLAGSTYFYDIMIYGKEEKQPYRMRISFDFGDGMDFEYYSYYDDPNPNYTVVERKDDYGEDHAYIEYNLCISLNPINNKEEYEGEFASLGLKAEDLKGVENVRKVSMGEAAFMSSINFSFYADHVTTEAETESCRTLLIDKLAEKGCKFYDALTDTEYIAAELKESGKASYYVEKGDSKFLLIVDPDSGFGDFGDSYGLVLTKKN